MFLFFVQLHAGFISFCFDDFSAVGEGCHKDTTPSGISDSTVSGTDLIVYIIPTVCGVILIAVLTVCIGCYLSYKKDVTLAKLGKYIRRLKIVTIVQLQYIPACLVS